MITSHFFGRAAMALRNGTGMSIFSVRGPVEVAASVVITFACLFRREGIRGVGLLLGFILASRGFVTLCQFLLSFIASRLLLNSFGLFSL